MNENGDAVNETHGFLHLKKKKESEKRKPFGLVSLPLPPTERRQQHKVGILSIARFLTLHMIVVTCFIFSITCPAHVNSVSVSVLKENS